MKRSSLQILCSTLLVAGLAQAYAEQPDAGITREQVVAETLESIRAGQVIANETGVTLAELYPDRYPAAAQLPGKSRAEVEAEVLDAIRQVGTTERALESAQFPSAYKYGNAE